jgi:hypothetical protein
MLPRNGLQVFQDALDACPFDLEEAPDGGGQRVRAPEAHLRMGAGAHPLKDAGVLELLHRHLHGPEMHTGPTGQFAN